MENGIPGPTLWAGVFCLAEGQVLVAEQLSLAPAHGHGAGRRRWASRADLRGLAAIHPLAALSCVIAYVGAGLAIGNPLQLVVVFAFLLAMLAIAGRLRMAWTYLRIGLYTAVLLIVINALVSGNGLTVLWEATWGPLHLRLTLQGIAFGIGSALRLLVVITAFALYVVVLDQDEQLSLISRLSFRSGLVASLATRMFPVLSRDAARISDAQRARGVELDLGRRRDRARARIPLLAALLTRSLERAMDVAESMEARGYGRRGSRSWYRGRPWRAADVATAACSFVAVAALIVGLFTGAFGYGYFPLLDDPLPGMTTVAWLVTATAMLAAGIVIPLARTARRRAETARVAPTGSPAGRVAAERSGT